MPQQSMPAKVEVLFKLRTQRMQEVRLGVTLSKPDDDSDSVLAGIQNEAEFAIDFDPANEKYDLFYRSANESGTGKVISIIRTSVRSTLSGALNATATAFTIVAPANTNSFAVGNVIEIEDELMILLTWDSGTGAATVEERGAHGTAAASHIDTTPVAKMKYTVPHNSIVLAGNLDSSLPLAPTTLVVTDVVGAVGNGLSIDIGLPVSQIKSLFRVHIQVSTVLWPEDFENTTGLTGTQASGADGAIVQGGTTLITSSVLNTGWAGKLIHTYESIDLLTGEVSAPDILRIDSLVDNGDGTWTVNVIGDNVFNLRHGKVGTAGIVSWTIVDDFRKPGVPSTWIEQVKPFFNQGASQGDPDVLAVQHILWTAETVYVRARLRNFEGYGPWIYHNGAGGTTTRASATTFSPRGVDSGGIEPGAIGPTEIADNSVTAAKLTENSMNYNSDLVFTSTTNNTVTWGSGTITFADGTSFSIVAGTTGVMAALTFIYLDPVASTTILQLTTAFATATGDRKQIVAWAKNTALAGERAFFNQLFGSAIMNSEFLGPNAVTNTVIADNSISTPKLQANSVDTAQLKAGAVIASKIQAGTITADRIQANTITGNEITGTTLSGIFLDIGSITSGNITGVTITGGTFRTAASGERLQMVGGSPNTIDWLNSIGVSRVTQAYSSGTNRFTIFHNNATANVGIRLDLAGNVFDFDTDDFTLFSKNIKSAANVECDSLSKSGAGVIAVNDAFDMNSNAITKVAAITPPSDNSGQCGTAALTWNLGAFTNIQQCASITPVSNNTGTVGSAALTYNTGYILNLVVGSFTADNGNNIVIDDHLHPNIHNTYSLGLTGTRYSNIWGVLINGADIGFANDWKIREWPCTTEDVQDKSSQWMREHANLGLQFINDKEEVMAVLHTDGYLYCKGVRKMEELPV